MILANVERDPAGRIVRLEVTGHDRSAPSGSNLVCAAVSAMTEMARYALLEVARLPVEASAAPGRVLFVPPPSSALDPSGEETVRVVLESLLGGFRRINDRYADRTGPCILVKLV